MTLTPNNYIENSCKLPVHSFPKPMVKGHRLALKAFADNEAAYHANAIVKSSMDHYLKAVNEWNAKPVKKTVRKTSTSVKKLPTGDITRISDEIRIIRRYTALHGKVQSRLTLLRLLSSLQKAMIEKRIRKTSPYAQEILQIQDQLIAALNRMGEQAEINIGKKYLEHYQQIASSQRIKDSIALLKRFVAIHGRERVQEKAKRLIRDMERLVKNGKIKKNDPYALRLNNAYKSLKTYIRDKKSTPEINSSELNGIIGLVGNTATSVKPAPEHSLKGVISSQDLMNMDFETIGLRGKFQELIGDPSVGFTAMVFGQPKSGKSTLMLDFAHHLAVNHGEVLYVAFEEGYGYTLKEKITRIGAIHPRLHFSEEMPGKLGAYDFVFIDSVSRAGMELEDMIELKNKYPRTSFIFIFHATKDGKFKGGNELAHEVDVIIEVENGMAKGKGRFGQGEMRVRF